MQTTNKTQTVIETFALAVAAFAVFGLAFGILFWEQIVRLVSSLVTIGILVGQLSAAVVVVLLAMAVYAAYRAFEIWLKNQTLNQEAQSAAIAMAHVEVLKGQAEAAQLRQVSVVLKEGEKLVSNMHLAEYDNPVPKNRMLRDTVVEGKLLQSMLTQQPNPVTLAASEVIPLSLPNKVDLLDLIPHGSSINNLVLGVRIDEKSNQLQTVSIGLEDFVHGAIGGSSGFGKSVLGRGIGYQLFTAPEPVEIGLIDLEGVTFSVFGKAPKLRYPLCDTVDGAVKIVQDLQAELKRRKRLFKAYPTVEKLSEYNAIAPTTLPPIVLMVDESTTLFNLSSEFETELTELALRARKYGIYLVLLGQDFTHRTLSTTIRNQLSSRVQLKAQDSTQSRILLGMTKAKDINQPGRGFCILPGRSLVELQTPYLDKQTCLRLQQQKAAETTTEVESLQFVASPKTETKFDLKSWLERNPVSQIKTPEKRADRILFLALMGVKSIREITGACYSSIGGKQFKQVQEQLIKAGYQIIDNTKIADTEHGTPLNGA